MDSGKEVFMKSKKNLNPIHGWLLIDKPAGLTSTQAVSRIKHALRPEKIGHAGTLDPFATGLLPLALGEATKVISFGMNGRKVYEFTLKFGSETTTEDIEGEITVTSDIRPILSDIQKVLPGFVGEIFQTPPAYSALKIEGKRAYDLARAGEIVNLAPRKIEIYSLDLMTQLNTDEFTFRVSCGKGTYVRSLGREIARKLGTLGHLTQLRRIQVGPFSIESAFSLDSFCEMGHKAQTDNSILPLQLVLDDILAIEVTEEEAQRLRHGQRLFRPDMITSEEVPVLIQTKTSKPIALGLIQAGRLSPYRVFNI